LRTSEYGEFNSNKEHDELFWKKKESLINMIFILEEEREFN